jgi:3-oxoacyl-[acyl-carrier-protein] synthase-1
MALFGHSQATWIVGCGARTPVGATAAATAAAVRANVSTFGDHPFMIDKAGAMMVVARDAFLGEEVCGVERLVGLGQPAARQALAPLADCRERPPTVPVLLGLPPPRPGLPEGLPEKVTEALRQSLGPEVRLGAMECFSAGHSAGLMALEEAKRRIHSGAADVCLAGGVDSYLEPETLEWLDADGRLLAKNNSFGFIPGEAAGFCLLCSQKALEQLGWKQVGAVLAAAGARETHLISNPEEVCLGEGLTKAFRAVLAALPSASAKVDHLICDLNGEPYRADELGYTMVRTSERFVKAGDFQNPAECWGDVGAASGPLFVTLAVVAGMKGYTKGPLTLVSTSSDAGQRCAALVQTGSPSEVNRSWQSPSALTA